MSRATTTVEGFVASDLTVQRTQAGKSVVNVSVPQQRSRKNDQGQWENVGETTWYQASFWEAEAELIASLVQKGTAVIVTGQPEAKVYQKQDGTSGVSVILNFPTLGVVPRVPKGQQQAQGASQGASTGQGEPWGQPPAQTPQAAAGDVWGTPQGGTYNDETPF